MFPALVAALGLCATAAVGSTARDGVEELTALLGGSWRTVEPVAQAGGGDQDASTSIVMHIAPVSIEGLPNAMYVETARADSPQAPYRQAIFQAFAYKNKVRLRTYEFRRPGGVMGQLVGIWAAPEAFPSQITRDDLIATLDIAMAPSGNGYAGDTPYPYPTGVGGAVQMTSHLEVSQDRMVSADRGFAPDGSIAWGSDEGDTYVYERFDPGIVAQTLDGGVIAIDLTRGGDDTLSEGDTLSIHYSGYTGDGHKFDSSLSRTPPTPMTFKWPGRMIPGFNTGLGGLRINQHRMIIIPGDQAYGERGNPRAGIEPNATLFFAVECKHIEHPAPPAPDQTDGGNAGNAADKGNQAGNPKPANAGGGGV